MKFAGRIWVDVTGVAPGSDSAVFADFLCAGFGRGGVDFTLCYRDPGLRAFAWPEMAWCDALPEQGLQPGALSRRQRLADRIPGPARRAILRFVQLQRAVAAARHVAAPISPVASIAGPVSDAVTPGAGDVLLMLGISGDASRFAKAGVRLAVYLVDGLAALRPEWLDVGARDAVAAWRRATSPGLSVAIASNPTCADALARMGVGVPVQTIRGAAVAADDAPRGVDQRFVLVAGPIGVAGATRHLLLAWRRLIETMAADEAPNLVLAGSVGPLAGDVLAQLHNSFGLGGKVRLAPFPSAALHAALLRDCLFCIAPDLTGGGLVTLEAQAMGVACLSASGLDGSVAIDPENAAALAGGVRVWLGAPPVVPAAPHRGWDAVADDVMRAIST